MIETYIFTPIEFQSDWIKCQFRFEATTKNKISINGLSLFFPFNKKMTRLLIGGFVLFCFVSSVRFFSFRGCVRNVCRFARVVPGPGRDCVAGRSFDPREFCVSVWPFVKMKKKRKKRNRKAIASGAGIRREWKKLNCGKKKRGKKNIFLFFFFLLFFHHRSIYLSFLSFSLVLSLAAVRQQVVQHRCEARLTFLYINMFVFDLFSLHHRKKKLSPPSFLQFVLSPLFLFEMEGGRWWWQR